MQGLVQTTRRFAMRPLHCFTLSLLLLGQPVLAEDLLKPPSQAEPPVINLSLIHI